MRHELRKHRGETYRQELLKNRAIITKRNVSLQILNEIVGTKFPGEVMSILSSDNIVTYETAEIGPQYLVEMINTLTAGSALSNHLLTLKVGFPVILLRNIDAYKIYVKSAHYIIKEIYANLLF